jgi:hypothetical protein
MSLAPVSAAASWRTERRLPCGSGEAASVSFKPGNCLTRGGYAPKTKRRTGLARVSPSKTFLLLLITALLSETSNEWETG